jgi:hypothetical protein
MSTGAFRHELGLKLPNVLPMDAPSPRWSPLLLPGSLRLVTRLSNAIMRPLRLPLSPHSLRFPSRAGSLVASRDLLARAAGSATQAPGRWLASVVQTWLFLESTWRLSQLSRIPPDASAPLLDPGPASLHLACAHSRGRLTMCSSVLSPHSRSGRPRRAADFRDSITRALALAPYASCALYRRATQCSLPNGCQPFSGGSYLPTGYLLHVSSSFR